LNFGSGGQKKFTLNSSSHGHLSLQGTSSFTGFTSIFAIDTAYVQGSAISFLGTFTNTTLASLGLSSTTGLLGTWTIGSDSIKLYAGPAPTNVPGPLPLLGASAAFGFSRKLRSRLHRSQSSMQI
jgi:hypothetical protein